MTDDEPYPAPVRTTPEEVQSLIDYFIRAQRRMPTLADVILMQEAVASVALSRDVDGETYSPDDVGPVPGDVGSDEKRYTAADMNRAYWEGHAAGLRAQSPYR